ncbi:unnamed protein product [Linum trigynum]|uniref:Uncharacterized protein n=1 Tax=Linum trigynum TaxID=586398 RepID=A0AAV2E805_9ROSI
MALNVAHHIGALVRAPIRAEVAVPSIDSVAAMVWPSPAPINCKIRKKDDGEEVTTDQPCKSPIMGSGERLYLSAACLAFATKAATPPLSGHRICHDLLQICHHYLHVLAKGSGLKRWGKPRGEVNMPLCLDSAILLADRSRIFLQSILLKNL